MRGSIFTSISAIAKELENSKFYDYDELAKKLAGTFEDKKIEKAKVEDVDENNLPLDACEAENGYPEPSRNIVAMMNNKQPACLRDILIALDMDSVTSDEAFMIGIYLRDNLTYKHRDKKEVTRNDKTYNVVMYLPDEFGKIEALIRKYQSQ